jgi:toxin-antitoxin system PIN domain toxin
VICLLDVNVLFVLHQPRHPHYALTARWFAERRGAAFATCPITQAGLLRLLTQPIADEPFFDMREARDALRQLTLQPSHVFWQDGPGYLEATEKIFSRLQGHRQITDAYLLGLAIHHGGKLATLDRGIRQIAGSEFAERVEIIEPHIVKGRMTR